AALDSRLSILPRPPLPPLSPYTTLFRSKLPLRCNWSRYCANVKVFALRCSTKVCRLSNVTALPPGLPKKTPAHRYCCAQKSVLRSEEHTSELQSRENLVCRLLLEKKNNK